MRYTNKFNLPAPLVEALTSDSYVRGDADFTATELITPTRIVSLRRKHDADLVEDVSDRAFTLYGQAYHVILERIAKANPSRYLVEQRFEAVMPGGVKISGQIDLFDKETCILSDYKTTSIFKYMLGDFEDWTQQLNINALLLRLNDFTVKGLQNVSFLKDWKARQARFGREPDYPKSPIRVTDLPLWPVGQTQSFVNERVEIHQKNMANPPVCTKRERWQRDATFAVMRTDRKRAIRLYSNKDQAEAAMMQGMRIAPPGDAKKFYIEERDAEPVRCLDFCAVQLQCDFGLDAEAKWKAKHEKND